MYTPPSITPRLHAGTSIAPSLPDPAAEDHALIFLAFMYPIFGAQAETSWASRSQEIRFTLKTIQNHTSLHKIENTLEIKHNKPLKRR